MASPTQVELINQLQNAVAMLDNFRATQTIPADIDTLTQSLESDFAQQIATGAELFRARAAAAPGSAADVLTAHIISYVHHQVQSPERTVQAALDRMYQEFVDNNRTLVARGFVFGLPVAAGGNTGNGTITRLLVDENGFSLENQFPDSKLFTVISDQQSGADRHEEIFEFRAQNAGQDVLDVQGSGVVRRNIRISSSNDSLLLNPTFSQFSVSGVGPAVGAPYTLVAGDTITGWTIASVTDTELTVDTLDILRDVVGDTTPTAVRFNNNNTFTQTFRENLVRLNPDVPYYVEFGLKRENAADGTLTVTLGSSVQTFDVSTLAAGFNRIALDADRDLWPISFNAQDAFLRIDWSGRTAGEIVIDEVTFVDMTPLDGAWYYLSGFTIKFLLDDSFSFADTIPSDSKIQRWLWRAFGRYLPAVLTAPLTAATAALAGAGAGNVDDGTHSWTVTFLDAQGVESGPSPISNVLNVVDQSTDGQVSLTTIPTGAANITQRRIYRSLAGDVTPRQLLTTITDNVTTIFTDNLADAGLGANEPAGFTISDPA